jgi:hypothetical protein
MHKLPLSIPSTGHYHWQSGNLDYRGSGGFYWSSSLSGKTAAYSLSFHGTSMVPQNNDTKTVGFTVRCVMRMEE